VRILRDRGLIEPDPPGPGQFAWAEDGAVAEHIESAGFVDYRVETVNFAFRFSDVEDWWRHQVRTSTRTADADAQMDSSTRSAVLDDLAAAMPDPTNIPARTWVAEATV
jgi:hypothetical protein